MKLIALLAVSLMVSIQAKVETTQTMAGRAKSALNSSYQYLQEKTAHAQSWIRHRFDALRGAPKVTHEHPEELLADYKDKE